MAKHKACVPRSQSKYSDIGMPVKIFQERFAKCLFSAPLDESRVSKCLGQETLFVFCGQMIENNNIFCMQTWRLSHYYI